MAAELDQTTTHPRRCRAFRRTSVHNLVCRPRDFISAVAHEAAAAFDRDVQQLMSKFIIGRRSADRLDVVLATMANMRVRHVPVIDDAS
jgi:hypothetical protein